MTKQTLADLSPSMRSALIQCFASGVKPGARKWSVRTLYALDQHGLIHLVMGRRGMVWRTTDQGNRVVCAHVPVFLHRNPARNPTDHPWLAAWQEPEVTAPGGSMRSESAG